MRMENKTAIQNKDELEFAVFLIKKKETGMIF